MQILLKVHQELAEKIRERIEDHGYSLAIVVDEDQKQVDLHEYVHETNALVVLGNVDDNECSGCGGPIELLN